MRPDCRVEAWTPQDGPVLRGLVIVLASACARGPDPAPDDLGQLGLYLFRHFDDADAEVMGAAFAQLEPHLQAMSHLAPSETTVTMPVLDGEDLDGHPIPDGVSAADQVPVAGTGLSQYPLVAQLELILEPNQVCIESRSTVWAHRTFLTPTGCFVAAQCPLSTQTEVRKETLIAKGWLDQPKEYRWFEFTKEDGKAVDVIAGRSWIDRVFEGDGGVNSWDQLFHLDVFMENRTDPATTLRWFSVWSSVTITGVSDDLYETMIIVGLEEALRYGDEFIAGDIVSCTLDRDAEKPDRADD
jgi:hypothetical protein